MLMTVTLFRQHNEYQEKKIDNVTKTASKIEFKVDTDKVKEYSRFQLFVFCPLKGD